MEILYGEGQEVLWKGVKMGKAVVFALFAMVATMFAQDVKLPAVEMKGGKTLMEALAARKTSRDFQKGATLTKQELSNLLWCANGFNRKGMRTAPSAVNAQAVDIYVFDAEGVWLYDAANQALKTVKKGDFRKLTGKQPFVANAAVNLLYVYDKAKWPMGTTDGKWASADASFCAENVYLYCASANLKTVVRGMFDEAALRQLLDLPESKMLVLTQSVGR